jgi:hypothetical protein
MNPEHWQRVEQLYHFALARDADERASFLAEAHHGDDGRQRQADQMRADWVSNRRFA